MRHESNCLSKIYIYIIFLIKRHDTSLNAHNDEQMFYTLLLIKEKYKTYMLIYTPHKSCHECNTINNNKPQGYAINLKECVHLFM